ncbi:MAG: 3-methyl-2-oxobutanoate dehydrogenase subunit VorB [Candidatus Promineifilaceae bacterium]|jgi:2-oxoglutarate ferredoxin oxidoreductase subunit alpha
MAKQLLKGNIAFAEAAVRAGCEAYFGYPITPQTELLEHMSKRMVELDRVFLQAESEVAAVNMVYGAAVAGARVMTSSSSPGISLMQEGFSYMAASDVPAVIIDVMRGGPGLGNIQPAQGDYFQVTRSAGHGDFRPIVLAPATVQEAIDLTVLAFDLAERYRTLVFVLADGAIGQMMEPAKLPPMQDLAHDRPEWALTGAKGRDHNIITSINLGAQKLEAYNQHLQEKLRHIEQAGELRYQEYLLDDADLVIVAFGTASRASQTALKMLREEGFKVGMLRPITLWPFPEKELFELAKGVKGILVVEMNAGQMLHDVREAVAGRAPVAFYGRMGGAIPLPKDIVSEVKKMAEKMVAVKVEDGNGHGR